MLSVFAMCIMMNKVQHCYFITNPEVVQISKHMYEDFVKHKYCIAIEKHSYPDKQHPHLHQIIHVCDV